jgi:hypothetical protein
VTTAPCAGGTLGMKCERRATCAHHIRWLELGGEQDTPWPLVVVPSDREFCANLRDYLPVHIPAPVKSDAPQMDLFA